MSGISLYYILFAIAIIIGLYYAIKYGKKAKSDIDKYENVDIQSENPYDGMRKMAFSVTAEQLGLDTIQSDEIYGVVSEMDMDNGSVSVITFITGDTSIYLSSGGGFIGAGEHESVKKVASSYINICQEYLTKGSKITIPELPGAGMTNFNFLTSSGIYRISESTEILESGTSQNSILFVKLNEVISEVRIKSAQ